MISVSGGRACRDRDGVARFAVLPLRAVAAAGLAARLGRSMVCLRRGDSAASTVSSPSEPSASSESEPAPPVSSDDNLDVTEDTRLLLVVSFAVDRAAARRDDIP
jgi:hypothetical protein